MELFDYMGLKFVKPLGVIFDDTIINVQLGGLPMFWDNS